MPSDLELWNRQLARELDQHREGKARLQGKLQAAHDRTYGSSTIYGQQLLKQRLSEVAEALKTNMVNIGRGKGAVDGEAVYRKLRKVDLDVVALLTMKVCFDVLGKEVRPLAQVLTTSIGSAIETQLRLDWYQSVDADLYSKTDFFFHKSKGTKYKRSNFVRAFNKAGLEWQRWANSDRHKVGAWALRGLADTTGWLRQRKVHTAPRRTELIIEYSENFLKLRDVILSKAFDLAYCMWPMLCPPNDWSNTDRGGYLTETIRQSGPIIRKSGFGQSLKQGDMPLQFLNNLQRQRMCINTEVLAVADWCYSNMRSVGKFIREERREPPTRPGDDASEEQVKEYKNRRRDIEDFNSMLDQKNWRTTETMFVARKYSSEQAFWLSWSYDYRGRCYCQQTFHPQGTDFDKSLFLFADDGPADVDRLQWHAATTYGLDKANHNARIQWASDHSSLIRSIAANPIDTIDQWEQADEPWCFLAACLELADVWNGKTTSALPCGIDATLSGVQHLSSLTLDHTAAATCNVVDAGLGKPADGYATVAEAAKAFLPAEYHQWCDRKLTKRVVMCTPYGLQRTSAKGYIKESLRNKGFDLSTPGAIKAFTDAIYDKAVPEIFQGPVNVMKFLQNSAKQVLDNGAETLSWTTPSGFNVVQDIRKSKTKRVQTHLMGSVLNLAIGDGYKEPDRQRHINAVAPGFVHSLDASLLHLTFAQCEFPFTVIHDCALARSCDVTRMGEMIRDNHAKMYAELPLVSWAEQMGVEIPDGLIIGDLDINEVRNSPYFFC